MKKIILVAEDLPEEQEKAKKVVLANNFKVVIAGTLEEVKRLWEKLEGKIAGILTDLHFPETVNDKNNNPNGLAIITRAIVKNVPVSVCSDIDHHFAGYFKTVIADLEKLTGARIPFTMDRKDWNLALENLKKIMEVRS